MSSLDRFKVKATYGIKVIPPSRGVIMPDKPFLSLPVKEMRKVSKKAAKIARKFNYKFRDQIDWDADE